MNYGFVSAELLSNRLIRLIEESYDAFIGQRLVNQVILIILPADP